MPRRKPITHETENTERWMVSYADFVTLLFAFFVVMYAISSVNDGKYRVLSDTLTDAFQTPPKSSQPIQIGEPVKSVIQEEQKPAPIEVNILPKSNEHYEEAMKQIADTVSSAVQPLIDKGLIKVNQDKLWVEIEMNTSILFPSASSDLEDEAFPALKALSNALKDLPNHIDVEGHTDNIPIRNEIFPSNWELSAARAASVVNLFTRNGVDPAKLSAIGYGEHRPITSNDSVDGRLKNRRVKVVILADKNARRLAEIDRTAESETGTKLGETQ